MSKSRKNLRSSNLYENDIEALDETRITKTRHVAKPEKIKTPQQYRTQSECRTARETIFGSVISERIVPCKCNKCGRPVNGDLISCIYSSDADIMTPFINYSCKGCGHNGFRSVKEKALPPSEFEKYYF